MGKKGENCQCRTPEKEKRQTWRHEVSWMPLEEEMTEKGRNAAETDVLLQGGRRRMGRKTGASVLLWPGQLLFCFLLQLQEGPGAGRRLRGSQACVLPWEQLSGLIVLAWLLLCSFIPLLLQTICRDDFSHILCFVFWIHENNSDIWYAAHFCYPLKARPSVRAGGFAWGHVVLTLPSSGHVLAQPLDLGALWLYTTEHNPAWKRDGCCPGLFLQR